MAASSGCYTADMTFTQDKLTALFELVQQADTAIMAIYETRSAVITMKADDSPLTQADMASHHILVEGLTRLFPDIPVVSEEGDTRENSELVQRKMFWLVDPIDGTKEFLNRSGDFTVCVALVEAGLPALGIISAPAHGVMYYGGPAMGSYKRSTDGKIRQIHVPTQKTGIVLGSRSHENEENAAYIEAHYAGCRLQAVGSQLKLPYIAEGQADAYPRIGSTMKLWDLAAGEAILVGAGGKVTRPDGSAVDYQTPTLLVGDFVATW